MLDRIGGYAPAQWAYGRLPSFDGRLFEGGNEVPFHSSEGTHGHDLRANLLIRVRAEEQYRKSQAAVKVSRAMSTKPRPFEVFLPGDLVYYRRYQVPHGETPSHPGLDPPKWGLARWYGPGRVLATETRSEDFPPSRKPAAVVWIIVAGKLKRCSPHQLRHCSERERLIAEASEAVSTPWSFTSLLHLVEKGQFQKFDDLELDESHPAFRERELRRSESQPVQASRARSRSRAREDAQNDKDPKKNKQGPQRGQQSEKKEDVGMRPPEKREREEQTELQRAKTAPRTSGPPPGESSSSNGPLFQHPPFVAAQRRSEGGSTSSALTLDELLFMDKAYVVEDGEEMTTVFMASIPLPEAKKDLKNFAKDSTAWVSKKLKRGAELRWKDIPASRLEDFNKAKLKELNSWIKEQAVKLVHGKVDESRVMKMRWIYTLKSDDSAKARIVIIGYQDPDLTQLRTTSPTMSRRTRGLFLTASSSLGWTVLKGDVRAAFLQGRESETERQVFAKPVRELSEMLGGDEKSVVQIAKACYGLANAPAQWHASVNQTMLDAGYEQLRTEPCCWKLMDRSDSSCPVLIGLACAHVDDFLFAGDSTHPQYQSAVSHLYGAYQWSPWEVDTYMHCGVQVNQSADGSVFLNHADYCSEITPIVLKDKNQSDKEPASSEQLQQLRAILGALQWRVYQSAPQHGARLSMLQSQLAHPTIGTLRETNKLVREVVHGRHVGLKYQKLTVENLEQVTFVAWADAAVGNRRDYSSSGGYFIGACEPSIANGKPSKVNPISWKSGKLPRVARSSLSGEIQAYSIAEEELMYVRLQWLEMIGHNIPDRNPISLLQQSRGIVVTDAKSLYDVILKGPQNSSGYGLKEKYSILDMMSIFQRLEKGATETRWVHSNAQIADSLTKPVANASLVRVLSDGIWTLVEDPTFTSAKRLKSREKTEASAKVFGASESDTLKTSDLPPPSVFAHACLNCFSHVEQILMTMAVGDQYRGPFGHWCYISCVYGENKLGILVWCLCGGCGGCGGCGDWCFVEAPLVGVSFEETTCSGNSIYFHLLITWSSWGCHCICTWWGRKVTSVARRVAVCVFMLGSWSDHARIILGSFSDRPRIGNDVSPVFEHFLWNFAVSFFVAGAVFGEVGSWHLLLRAL